MTAPFELMRGDCLELMAAIPAGSVDLILCDLPYGTTACKWDSVVPFAPLWEHYRRIIKPNGAIVLFGAEPFSSKLRMSNPDWFKYDWYWKKNRATGFLNAKRQPLRNVETLSVFYAKQPTYNPQFTPGTPYPAEKGGKTSRVSEAGATTYGRFMRGAESRNENHGIRYPKQMIDFSVIEQGTVHPTQKPVPLLEYLINTYTNPGESVLDNCMGSGSTGVAAANTGRDFIGIELDDGYFGIARERIKTAYQQAAAA